MQWTVLGVKTPLSTKNILKITFIIEYLIFATVYFSLCALDLSIISDLMGGLLPNTDVASPIILSHGLCALVVWLYGLKSIRAFADWVLDQLDALGVDCFNLLGHSMAGMIVQKVARRAGTRIDKLILYSTGAQGVLPGRFENITQSKAHPIARL